MGRPIPAPSEIVPSLPDSVDQVVLWALERDPAMRPESAEHFRLALEEALAVNGMIGPHDLAAWMKVTFADRLAQRTQFERRCVEEMRARRSSDRLPVIEDAGLTPPPDPSGALHFVYDPMGAPDVAEPDVADAGRAGTGSASIPATVLTEPRRAWIAPGLAAFALLVITGSAIAWHLDRDEVGTPPVARLAVAPPAPPSPAAAPTTRRSFEVAVSAVPEGAVIEIDDIEVGRGSFRVSLPMDGVRHVLTVRARGYETRRVDFTDQPPPARVHLERIGGERRPLRARKTPRKTPRRRAQVRPMTDNPDPWRDDGGRKP
jgi:hypothetical protein